MTIRCCYVNYIQDIDNWAFDVFQINDVGEGHALKYVGVELLQKYDLINKYKVPHPTSHLGQLSLVNRP